MTGVAAIGAASLVVNQPMKLPGNRARPDRAGHEVPEARWVAMPTSTSFPSGHSASALAFAVAVGDVIPALRWPLRVAGGTVAFSRVYTGVHYPGDVLVGAATGALLGRLVSRLGERVAQPLTGASTMGAMTAPTLMGPRVTLRAFTAPTTALPGSGTGGIARSSAATARTARRAR